MLPTTVIDLPKLSCCLVVACGYDVNGLRRVVFAIINYSQDEEWLQHQLNQKIDLSNLIVDSAPFQLTDKTSLYKVCSFDLI